MFTLATMGSKGVDERPPDAVRSGEGGVPRFVLVSHYLPPSRYGQPRVIQRLLQDLPASTYRLLSVEAYDRSVTRDDQDAPWLPGPYVQIRSGVAWKAGTHRHPFNRIAPIVNAFPSIIARARDIAREIRSEGCQVAVACSGDIADLPATWLACRWTGARFVAYMFDDYVEQWAFLPALRSLAQLFEGRFARDAVTVIVPNEYLRREYCARYGEGVDLTVINNPWLSEPAVVREPSARPETVRITYTGSIYHVHFDAFQNLSAALRELGEGYRLDIYSATPPEVLSVNGIDTFTHHGHVSDSQALDVQRDADILFLPLAFRSSAQAVIRTSAPGKLGEYLASGQPVLVHAPADTFIAWYGREYGCAHVVSDPDPAALAQAIRRLSDDPEYARSLVRAARERAEQDFSPAVAQRRFAGVLARAAGSRP
jgi:glycosyltransferase involved in cell wall biosynthesis